MSEGDQREIHRRFDIYRREIDGRLMGDWMEIAPRERVDEEEQPKVDVQQLVWPRRAPGALVGREAQDAERCPDE